MSGSMQPMPQGAAAPSPPPQMPMNAALPQGVPPPVGAPPGLATFARGAQAQPSGQLPPGLKPQEAAAMGRLGDSVISHLTPGEIVINPRMLPPQLMQTIMQAFQQAGVDPRSMIVGSPAAPHNPQTGMEEHNGLLGSLLPLALGIAGSVLAPEALPALGLTGIMGTGAASALGGGLGSAAGAFLGGGNTNQALMSGLGSAAGSYMGGKLTGGGAPATNVGNADTTNTQPFGGDGWSPGAASGQDPAMGTTKPGSMWGQGIGAGLGAALGGALTPATAKPQTVSQGTVPYYDPKGPSPLNGRQQQPTFAGYNPFAAVTGSGYNFYPGA